MVYDRRFYVLSLEKYPSKRADLKMPFQTRLLKNGPS